MRDEVRGVTWHPQGGTTSHLQGDETAHCDIGKTFVGMFLAVRNGRPPDMLRLYRQDGYGIWHEWTCEMVGEVGGTTMRLDMKCTREIGDIRNIPH